MANYQEVRFKRRNTQLNRLKSATRNKNILRITKKKFQDEELPHELFLATRQKTKIRNAFANIVSIDIKFSKAQLSKMIQSGGFLRNMLVNLGEKVITDLAIPLTRDDLLGLVSNITSNEINKFKRKINGKGSARAGKGFILFSSNEDMNDIIKIIKSLEDDGITETVKH